MTWTLTNIHHWIAKLRFLGAFTIEWVRPHSVSSLRRLPNLQRLVPGIKKRPTMCRMMCVRGKPRALLDRVRVSIKFLFCTGCSLSTVPANMKFDCMTSFIASAFCRVTYLMTWRRCRVVRWYYNALPWSRYHGADHNNIAQFHNIRTHAHDLWSPVPLLGLKYVLTQCHNDESLHITVNIQRFQAA